MLNFYKSLLTLALALFFYSGALAVPNGPYTPVQNVHTAFSSTNVTSGAYVTIIASTVKDSNFIEIFDCSGLESYLQVFQSDCATPIFQNPLIIVPGGNGQIGLSIPKNACIRLKALSTTLSSCFQDVTLYQ